MSCGKEQYWHCLRTVSERGRFIMGRVMELEVERERLLSLFYGETKPASPVRISVFRGTRLGDFMYCDPLEVWCISQEAVDCLRAHGITGWDTYPVEVLDRRGVAIPGYLGLAITGRIGYLVGSESRLEEREPPVPQGKPYRVYVGMQLDCSEWDGSDLCTTAPSTSYVWANQRAVDAIWECKLTNVEYERVDQMDWHEALFSVRKNPSVRW